MNKVYPAKLEEGDKIAVIAPSASFRTVKAGNKKIARQRLEGIGFKIEFGGHLSEIDVLHSSSIESRVKDFHAAFKDKNVKGILAARGGFICNEILQYLDWNLIKKNPKIFCGFSDITVLSNAIYAKTGLVTYSGPNFSTFGRVSEYAYVEEYFRKCLMQTGPYEIKSSKKWADRGASFKNKGYEVIQGGTARGTLIGGNLCSVNLLQGTEYMPSLKNSILFIEDDDLSGEYFPGNFDRDLQSLLHLPDAKYLKGVVVGRFQRKSAMTTEKLKRIVGNKKELKKIPIIANADFGHTDPLFTYPVGGTVEIKADKGGVSIRITEH